MYFIIVNSLSIISQSLVQSSKNVNLLLLTCYIRVDDYNPMVISDFNCLPFIPNSNHLMFSEIRYLRQSFTRTERKPLTSQGRGGLQARQRDVSSPFRVRGATLKWPFSES
jgi:hypothetical protein